MSDDITDEDLRREREEAQELAKQLSPRELQRRRAWFAAQMTRQAFGSNRRRGR